jgi:hypothetical protein
VQPIRPTRLIPPATLALGLLLSACQKPIVPVVEVPPVLPPHLGPPPAATCTVSPFKVADGGTVTVAMTISNDGGYCAAALANNAGQPYDAPLVPARALHGDETVVKYNGKTSIEYTAHPGYVGPDTFTVHLINKGQPGYTTVTLNITVQPAAAPPPAKTS